MFFFLFPFRPHLFGRVRRSRAEEFKLTVPFLMSIFRLYYEALEKKRIAKEAREARRAARRMAKKGAKAAKLLAEVNKKMMGPAYAWLRTRWNDMMEQSSGEESGEKAGE